eukprot:scaffold214489_cov17-Prasinocladus_malaysianus.AAC.2
MLRLNLQSCLRPRQPTCGGITLLPAILPTRSYLLTCIKAPLLGQPEVATAGAFAGSAAVITSS